jgi:ABC-type uncharacterized transport system permease subunit
MIAIAHFVAITFYFGAAALAATLLARPVGAPTKWVLGLLGAGVASHAVGLLYFARSVGAVPLTGLGPALSFAGFALAATLLVVELLARDVSLTLVAGPLAAIPTMIANVIGLSPGSEPPGWRGLWLLAHIVSSFLGIAAFATAAAAGTMYLIERRELKSRRFGALFRFFPPLATLDRVNHVAAIAGGLGLTVGIALAASYSITYRQLNELQLIWGTGAWLGVSGVAIGRMLGKWQARRAAIYSSVTFAAVLLLYVAFRVAGSVAGKFL